MYFIQISDNQWCAFCPETLEISIYDNKKRFEKYERSNFSSQMNLSSRNPTVNKFPIKLHRVFIGVSEMCNMACDYCYASAGTYGHDGMIMSPHAAIQYIDKYKSVFSNPLKVVFFGGEPLLAQGTIQSIISHLKSMRINASYGIITNGTLLSESVIRFIKANNIAITVSMDGAKEFHDHYRKFKDGSGSFDTIAANVKKALAFDLSITAEATCGPNFFESYEQGMYSDFRKVFEEIGFKNLHVGVAVKPNGYSQKATYGIEKFFIDMADDAFNQFLTTNGNFGLVSGYFKETLMCLIKKTPLLRCGAGHSNAYISVQGDLYCCHLFHAANADRLNDDDYRLPNAVEAKNIEQVRVCSNCFCRKLCLAWCPGISASMNRSEYSVISERCTAQKAFTMQILKRFAEIYLNKDEWELFSTNWKRFMTHGG